MFKKWDIAVYGVIIAVVVASFVFVASAARKGTTAVVIYEDKEFARLDLTSPEPQTVDVDGKASVVAENGRVRIASSTCPDKLCVERGWCENSAQVAVCLPNKILLKIEGGGSEVDSVTY